MPTFLKNSSILKVLLRKARRVNRTEESAEYGEKQPYLNKWKLWFTRLLEAAKLKGKVDKAKWWQSDSKCLENLAQEKPNPNTFDIECGNWECELVFEQLAWFSILSTRWLLSDNLFGNPYPSPLAREDDSQLSNIWIQISRIAIDSE